MKKIEKLLKRLEAEMPDVVAKALRDEADAIMAEACRPEIMARQALMYRLLKLKDRP